MTDERLAEMERLLGLLPDNVRGELVAGNWELTHGDANDDRDRYDWLEHVTEPKVKLIAIAFHALPELLGEVKRLRAALQAATPLIGLPAPPTEVQAVVMQALAALAGDKA